MSDDNTDIEKELHDFGIPLGQRVLELTTYREKAMTNSNNICQYGKREVKIVNMLHFINNQCWKTLFGKTADGIEQSLEDEDEYRIIDSNPLTNKYVSSGQQPDQDPRNKNKVVDAASIGPNCANFLAGIIEGILCSNKMYCKVSAHFVPDEDQEVP